MLLTKYNTTDYDGLVSTWVTILLYYVYLQLKIFFSVCFLAVAYVESLKLFISQAQAEKIHIS